jgi:hypothetical protein
LRGVGAGAVGVGDLVPGVAVGAGVVDELGEEAFGLFDASSSSIPAATGSGSCRRYASGNPRPRGWTAR